MTGDFGYTVMAAMTTSYVTRPQMYMGTVDPTSYPTSSPTLPPTLWMRVTMFFSEYRYLFIVIGLLLLGGFSVWFFRRTKERAMIKTRILQSNIKNPNLSRSFDRDEDCEVDEDDEYQIALAKDNVRLLLKKNMLLRSNIGIANSPILLNLCNSLLSADNFGLLQELVDLLTRDNDRLSILLKDKIFFSDNVEMFLHGNFIAYEQPLQANKSRISTYIHAMTTRNVPAFPINQQKPVSFVTPNVDKKTSRHLAFQSLIAPEFEGTPVLRMPTPEPIPITPSKPIITYDFELANIDE